jgi:catechol 2,3-dioxygenase-like lactoylglutathione lyase family enzyme
VAAVRYLVEDADVAAAFYVDVLGFAVDRRMGTALTMVKRGDLVLWLSGPETSAARPMPNGDKPVPGGWNRLVLEVKNLDVVVERLREAGARFRNEPISGPGGRQVLVEDPSGNPIELFQPA